MQTDLITLSIALQSHINAAMTETGNVDLQYRLKFIKAITFFNSDLNQPVSTEYLNFIWSEIEAGRWGTSFDLYNAGK